MKNLTDKIRRLRVGNQFFEMIALPVSRMINEHIDYQVCLRIKIFIVNQIRSDTK